jgi:hypothetical protein
MSTSHVAQALDSVAALRAGGGPGAWRIERAAMADRLAELVREPDLVRQGRLNLCGPAALYVSWLRRDPVAVVRFARDLYEHGRARLGPRLLMPSRGLREHPYGGTERARGCPPADWMLLAALRDATNRVLPYSRPGGLREPPAAITMPGAVRSWLTGTGCFTEVVDETVLVRRPGLAHASGLVPGPDEDVFLLIAQEMFFAPRARWRRARNRVVSLVPNHWVLLRSPVTLVGDEVRFAFWSWGRVQVAGPSRVEFERCYHGALRAVGKTLAGLERAT